MGAARRENRILVAPFVGAWIEMTDDLTTWKPISVAPFVGAWIEIGHVRLRLSSTESLPSWERGLK